ncbi:MaoC/PaaZ C-terminal domain-containing protein [Bacillus sp. 165]|uniref:MaoC family dehydratase n=1 Tax=Bacillus sp. 165 TaxID=1529117 RepID=UPI001ADAE4F7|nr:MaoC/PaaZ C-terminal domain-containing protein [Bacillus sp. 165]MBO9130608.1 MaoC family dehydratase N-terminal domain-containing protein [Bacillus sp. 165]
MLRKKGKLGRKMEEISVGEKLTLTEKIEDKDLLLYLGLTDDANPLYIQHDYASQTPYQKPIVPSSMLTGIVTTAVTKYLPGPGSHVVRQELEFSKPVYHYATLQLEFEVVAAYPEENLIEMRIFGEDEQGHTVIKGMLTVCPPHQLSSIMEKAMDNF